MRADRAAPRHASDGGGRAWIEAGSPVAAGGRGRWRILYEAGPLGVAAGGAVFLQVSPFWGWSTPQVESEGAPGFTRLAAEADGVELLARTLDQGLLRIEIGGRALAAGERIAIDYGCGPAGARADDYAEACSRFWIALDGDGDGIRKVLEDSPCTPVGPGPPALLAAILPSVVRPGEPVRVVLAALDARANRADSAAGRVELGWLGAEDLDLAPVELASGNHGAVEFELPAPPPGLWRLAARLESEGRTLAAESNPLEVSPRSPRILWGDLHGHTADSDGTGTPEDYYRYAREVAGLDVAVLTDHDHWGMLFLDDHPAIWEANVAAARRAGAAGRFLALPGFEWTSWIHGHRHVVFFGETARIFSSIDERFDTPEELWTAIEGAQALSIPHHPAGGPIALDWSRVGHPTLEPLIEICSAHGSSEAPDGVRPIYDADEGSWVRSALERGLRAGLVASGDGHDGHPGLAHLGPHYPTGGLAAILADEPSAPRVLEALRARRVYATSGPRILLRFALGRARMGEVVSPAPAGAIEVYARAVGTAGLASVDLIRGGKLAARSPGQGRRDLELAATVADLRPGEFLYVRVLQEDGHGAWSSPIWIE